MNVPEVDWRFTCPACGFTVDPTSTAMRRHAGSLRCPQRGTDDGDHVLRRGLTVFGVAGYQRLRASFGDDESNPGDADPFVRYRALLTSHAWAIEQGLTDSAYLRIIDRLARETEALDGRRVHVRPCTRQERLSRCLGFSAKGGIWIKDETRQPAGSHKARHLMGILLWLEVAAALHGEPEAPRAPDASRLAIASCGNAALAAAVLARAAGRPLDVFVPDEIRSPIRERLQALGARLTPCPRSAAGTGDPCVVALEESVRHGTIPFTVQGHENALAIEGGMTLGYEIVSAFRRTDLRPDRLFVQVGGGALASAVVQALGDARRLGLINKLPRIHAVQTTACHPLERAHRLISAAASRSSIDAVLMEAAAHRSPFMWPWETPGSSIAGGILDDETYDGLAVIRAMLETDGYPIVVGEERLAETLALAARAGAPAASATGIAGLAGLAELAAAGRLDPDEKLLVIFTGAPGT